MLGRSDINVRAILGQQSHADRKRPKTLLGSRFWRIYVSKCSSDQGIDGNVVEAKVPKLSVGN